MQDQLVVLHSASQLDEQPELQDVMGVVGFVVRRDPGVRPLGQVHRHVGALQQQVDRVTVLRQHGDPDAGVHCEVDALHLEGVRAEPGQDLRRHALGA